MRSYYAASVSEFLATSPEIVMGALEDGLAADGFNRTPEQRASWRRQVSSLAAALKAVQALDAARWNILLEYSIPGRQKRLDAVVLSSRGITVVEFKIGKGAESSADKWQLLEYCWNLRDFHRESAGRLIAPILVPSEFDNAGVLNELAISDLRRCILSLQVVGLDRLADAIQNAFDSMPDAKTPMPTLDVWQNSRISPSQTIIQAAREQFGRQSVREIEHSHADNTTEVVAKIAEVVRFSQKHRRRSICFVTGVPGAGKTLVGLRVAYLSEATALAESGPCFASGNLKLLSVLGKALGLNLASTRADIRHTVHDLTAPLWDIHKFARLHASDPSAAPPAFRVVVFDEAQRVWTAEKVQKSMRRRLMRGGQKLEIPEDLATCSEPELLLRMMERFEDWCVVVALVGGGQEIHDGEAGLRVWGEVLQKRAANWDVWASAEALGGGASVAGQSLFGQVPLSDRAVHQDESLHLRVTRRSHRATRITEWVNAVLQGNAAVAREAAQSLTEFKIELTRSLATARKRLREFTQDDQRIGLLTSSGARRLRAEGIEVLKPFRDAIDWPKWFLAPNRDINSSSQLEVAATEFECQGLELDHTCVCWGTDMVHLGSAVGWRFRSARGKRLLDVNEHPEGPYVVNKYRVLLTRAREGMIVFVPRGCSEDPTRSITELDGTAKFLCDCGLREI